MSVHIPIEELAAAAAGALEAGQTGEVEAHLRQCATCRDSWAALTEVSERLAAEPAPAMPAHVAQRLDGVLTQLSAARATASGPAQPPATVVSYPRPTLGSFGADLARPRRSKLVWSALAACAAAAVVGFAGYVLSASAGLNEPNAAAPAVVSTEQLGAQANSLLRHADLSPHRFSQAWQCAREVTSGRITAITSAVVDGQPALLVYTRSGGVEQVTVVTGCSTGNPTPGSSTTLPR